MRPDGSAEQQHQKRLETAVHANHSKTPPTSVKRAGTEPFPERLPQCRLHSHRGALNIYRSANGRAQPQYELAGHTLDRDAQQPPDRRD